MSHEKIGSPRPAPDVATLLHDFDISRSEIQELQQIIDADILGIQSIEQWEAMIDKQYEEYCATSNTDNAYKRERHANARRTKMKSAVAAAERIGIHLHNFQTASLDQQIDFVGMLKVELDGTSDGLQSLAHACYNSVTIPGFTPEHFDATDLHSPEQMQVTRELTQRETSLASRMRETIENWRPRFKITRHHDDTPKSSA